ncbi:flippase [Natribaculum luteum]|uniref:Flippase n=1 Tax=Natribaculum luteum TaxID=1586232 RepID=A0ABD5NZA1_9EURY|nr:flippase [Natribaculum luteum]
MATRESELSALLSSAALVMIGGIISSAAKMGERIIIGRLLSPDAYGEVSIGLALFTITSTIALAGCTQGVSRFIPRYDSIEDQRGVWLSGLLIATPLSLVISILMFVFAESIAAHFFETDYAESFIRLLALTLPFVANFRIIVAAIRGFENTTYPITIQNFFYPFLRIGLIAGLLLAGMSAITVGIAYFFAALLTFVIAHLLLRRFMNLRGEYQTHVSELLTFSAPLIVSTVVSVMLTKTDTLMLGYFRSSSEVGMYDAAYSLASGLTVVLGAFGFLYLPLASRLDADGERKIVDDIYATTTKWVYVITFPVFLLFVIFPNNLILIFFGPSYADAASVLPILAVGFFLSAAAGRNRETLSAIGLTAWIAIGNLIGIVLNILINIVLIPRFGFMGAGVASVVSLFSLHTTICGVLAIRYNITPFSSEAIRCYVFLPAILLPLAHILSPWIVISAMTLIPILIAVSVVSLVVVVLIGGLEPDDIVVITVLEDKIGISVPLVRRWIPDANQEVDLFSAD